MPCVMSGRLLKEAPAWADSDGALFFDAGSGDYWVLAPDAAAALRCVMAGMPDQHATSATIDSLVAAGLLERHASTVL